MIDKNKKYCLFFDWDGTLKCGRDVSPENIAALEKVKEAGHYIFLNSGRGRSNVPPYAANLVKWDGIIAGMSYAEMNGKVVMEKYMPKSALRQVCRFYEVTKAPLCIQGNSRTYLVGHDTNDERLVKYSYFKKLVEADADALKVTNIAVDGNILEMKNNVFDGCWTIYHEEGDYSEIMLNGYNKATGIKLVCDTLGIDTRYTVSFGDSINDVDMLRFTGISVIMKSAIKELDEIATMRTEDDRCGVAEAIGKLFFDGKL